MDFNEVFRQLFGFRTPPNGHDQEEFPGGNPHPFGFIRPGFDHHGNSDDEDNTDDDDNKRDMDPFGRRGGFGFGWDGHSDPFADLERQTEDMFRHFEEMFKNFGLSDFHTEPPSIETTPNRRRLSPRDEMLKEPDELKETTPRQEPPSDPRRKDDNPVRFGDVFRSPWQWHIPALPSASQGDENLDEQVKDGKLDELLKPEEKQRPPGFSWSFSKTTDKFDDRCFSKSISIRTVRKPDGTIERWRTKRDSNGNETTTVTTTQDDNHASVLKPNRSSTDGDPQKQTLIDKFFGSWNR